MTLAPDGCSQHPWVNGLVPAPARRHHDAVWFTADLHFGHANIIRYSDRPFSDPGEMNHALIERWNEVVDQDDTVWVLGDVALGQIASTLPLVGALHGHKLLLAGNHDRCWVGHGQRAAGWTERYREAGFAEIHQGQLELEVAGTTVDVSHFPYRGDSQDLDRHVDRRPVDRGRWLVHGHVHEQWRQRGRMINVGTDAWRYRPVAAEEVAALIDAGPGDLAPL